MSERERQITIRLTETELRMLDAIVKRTTPRGERKNRSRWVRQVVYEQAEAR